MRLPSLFLGLILLAGSLRAVDEPRDRAPWALDPSYEGAHQEHFKTLHATVPILLRQTAIRLSARLGLRFEDGWNCPLVVRFVDGGRPGAENTLAFVAGFEDETEHGQILFINLDAYDRMRFDFEAVLAHELVHAMMNDVMGVRMAAKIPVWASEGLAVFGAEQTEKLLSAYAPRFRPPNPPMNGLDGPHGALDYLEDALAFEYMNHRHGPNAVPAFVRELIRHGGDAKAAVDRALFVNWETFSKGAAAFASERLAEEWRRGDSSGSPY